MKFCHWLHSDGKSCQKLTLQRQSRGKKSSLHPPTKRDEQLWMSLNMNPLLFLSSEKPQTPWFLSRLLLHRRGERSQEFSELLEMHKIPWPSTTLQMFPYFHTELGFEHSKKLGISIFLFLKKFFSQSLLHFCDLLVCSVDFFTLNLWTKWNLNIKKKQARQTSYYSPPQIYLVVLKESTFSILYRN